MRDKAELLAEFLKFSDDFAIVEGRKDKEALESLGFSKVIQLGSNNSIYSIVESLQGKKNVSILTDLDKEGKALEKRILQYFNMYGIQENKEPREILFQMNIQHIESLRNLANLI